MQATPPSTPAFGHTTRLVARALGVEPARLHAGLRVVREDDLPRVRAFRTSLAGAAAGDADERYLRWRYRLGRDAAPALGELWLLEAAGRLVALLGTEDVVLHAGARRLVVERPMDLQIAPEVRESGLGVWMNQAAAARAGALLAIGCNAHSRGIVQRLFTPLAPLRTYTYVIDSRPFLRKAGLRGPFSALAAAGGNAALRLRVAWFAARRRGRGVVRPSERFDAADPLHDARPAGDALAFERSAAALNHRLFDNPRARYLAAGATVSTPLQAPRCGAVAWRVEPGLGGAPHVRVVDLWARGGDATGDEDVIEALLMHVFDEARRAGAHAVRLATADPRRAAQLARLGFASPGAAGEGMPMGLLVPGDAALAHTLAALPCAITAVLDDDDGTYAAYGAPGSRNGAAGEGAQRRAVGAAGATDAADPAGSDPARPRPA
ncbi:MAG: hypothetical protein KJ023_04955 [Burkholderiaceae bacterium]|nr:hypothetical protein [Burkholderiaceae bacterium]